MSQLPVRFPAWPAGDPWKSPTGDESSSGPAWTARPTNEHNPRVKVDRSWPDENRADWTPRHERSRRNPQDVPVSDWTGPAKTGPGPA